MFEGAKSYAGTWRRHTSLGLLVVVELQNWGTHDKVGDTREHEVWVTTL